MARRKSLLRASTFNFATSKDLNGDQSLNTSLDSSIAKLNKDGNFVGEFTLQLQWHRRNLLTQTLTFVPGMVSAAYEDGAWTKVRPESPLLEHHTGCVLKVVFSGLHQTAERQVRSAQGASLLQKRLTKFFTPLADIVDAYGGDVIHVDATALLALFLIPRDSAGAFRNTCGSLRCNHSSEELASLRAAACSLELQKRLPLVDIGDTPQQLSFRIGLGAGYVGFFGIQGDTNSSLESFKYAVLGPPLEQAAAATRLADPGGAVLSPEVWRLVGRYCRSGPPLENASFHRLAAFDITHHTYPMVRHAAQQSRPEGQAVQDAREVRLRLSTLMQFLPHAVLRHIWSGTLRNINEMRTVSVACLRVDGLDTSTRHGAIAASRLLHSLQLECYGWEGSLSKVLAEGHSLLLHFAFGRPPLVHTDDPARACRAMFRMVRAVIKSGLMGRGGVATGRVFCGLVGSQRRREYNFVGEVVELAQRLSKKADSGTLVVDSCTQVRCNCDLRFAALGTTGSFQVLGLGEEEHTKLQRVPSSSSPKACTPKAASLAEDAKLLPLFREGPKERQGGPGSVGQPLISSKWAHLAAEVPTMKAGRMSPTHRTRVSVPLPWPARSSTCGGSSPLPQLKGWSPLLEAEHAVDRCVSRGGGSVRLVGSFGCGKTELTEHLVAQLVQGPQRMLPVFGAMEVRAGQQWSAVRGVLRGLAELLDAGSASGQIRSHDDVCAFLTKEAATPSEVAALQRAGLGEAHPEPGSPGYAPPRTPNRLPMAALNTPPRVESPSREELVAAAGGGAGGDVGEDQALACIAGRLLARLLVHSSVVVALRISQGTSLLGVDLSHFWALAQSLGDLAASGGGTGGSSSLGHPLLVLICCQESHLDAPQVPHELVQVGHFAQREVRNYVHLCLGAEVDGDGTDSDYDMKDALSVGTAAVVVSADTADTAATSADSLKNFGPTSTQKSTAPGLPGSLPDVEHADPEEDMMVTAQTGAKVPLRLSRWLYCIADLPRHLEEGILQLQREGIIEIRQGECVLRANLHMPPSIASWVHTQMVGRIISQMELMVPEMQHALQIATVLSGPFSSLDLACTNRLHLSRNTPNMIVLYHCVKRLTACEELVQLGFLRRRRRLTKASTDEDEEQRCLPFWEVASYLVKQVVSSTLLQGKKMQLKRVILVNRAITQRRRALVALETGAAQSSRSEAASHVNTETDADKARAEERRQQRSLLHSEMLSTDTGVSSSCGSLPSSCIIIERHGGTGHDHGSDSDTEKDLQSTLDKFRTTRSDMSDAEDMTAAAQSRRWSGSMSMANPLAKFGSQRAISSSWSMYTSIHRQIEHIIIFVTLATLLLWPDLCILMESSSGTQDAVMLIAASFFAADILSHMATNAKYRHTLLYFDLVILTAAFLDISWALGKPPEELEIQRKNESNLWRMIGMWVKFGASAGHLSRLMQFMARLIVARSEWWRWRSGSSRENVTDSSGTPQMLEDISAKLARSILLTLVVFTMVTIVCLQVIDVFTPPQEDASMESWAELISERSNSSVMVAEELGHLEAFYRGMNYGPFWVCRGVLSAGEFTCQEPLLHRGRSFSEPGRRDFRLDVETSSLQASFNFATAAKAEAFARVLIICLTVVLMVGVAVSLDFVIARLVVAPLARLLPTIRQVRAQLLAAFPTLGTGIAGIYGDEVEAFEEMVSKMTALVTISASPQRNIQEVGHGAEWMGGNRFGEVRRDSLNSRTLRARKSWPDLSALEAVGVPYSDVHSWHFDVLSLDGMQLMGVSGWILLHSADENLNVDPQVMCTFLNAISLRYSEENPYHNWRHAVDVSHVVFRCCHLASVQEFASRVEVFALVVAAAAHDVGHPGVNNQFLVETSHELALRYNDVSPLENMHCSTLFGILSSLPGANVFGSLSREQYTDARRICIESILYTDNAHHFQIVKDLQLFYNSNFIAIDHGRRFPSMEEVELFQQASHRRMLLCAILHAADISNTCKPWKICEPWAHRVINEFFLQGDKEKELGIPVQMLNNRETLRMAGSQVAFIELFVAPFMSAQVKILPPLSEMCEFLQVNLQKWQACRVAEEPQTDQDYATSSRNVKKVVDELQEVCSRAQWRLGEHVELVVNTNTRSSITSSGGAAMGSDVSNRSRSPTDRLRHAAEEGGDLPPSPTNSGSIAFFRRTTVTGEFHEAGGAGGGFWQAAGSLMDGTLRVPFWGSSSRATTPNKTSRQSSPDRRPSRIAPAPPSAPPAAAAALVARRSMTSDLGGAASPARLHPLRSGSFLSPHTSERALLRQSGGGRPMQRQESQLGIPMGRQESQKGGSGADRPNQPPQQAAQETAVMELRIPVPHPHSIAPPEESP